VKWLVQLLCAAWALGAPQLHAQEYSFDLSEIEPAPLTLSGFVQPGVRRLGLSSEAATLPLSDYAGHSGDLWQWGVDGELAATYRAERLTLYGRWGFSADHDTRATDARGTVLEAAGRYSVGTGLSVDVGKQVQRWGKGYAWNPVAFFERPKDLNDPEASREGYVMATADAVWSQQGPVAAFGFMPVLLPVSDTFNPDYGGTARWNVGAKAYLLWNDTDIDLLWAARGSRPARIGLDFSRNLGTNLEVHGEWARTFSATRRELGADGVVRQSVADTDSWLLGLRYITEREVTWIVEWYRNGMGYDDEALGRYYRLAETAFSPGGTAGMQQQVRALAQAGYGRASPGRDYLYLRVSAKDPFDWLYVTPAMTWILNVHDRSWQWAPEVTYTGITNTEWRVRWVALGGANWSEFAEKPVRRRMELSWKRWF
jgi:hypothetical protein